MYQLFPNEKGHLLDESFFRLVNKDNGGLKEAAHLAGDLGSLDLILWTEQIYKISNTPIKHIPIKHSENPHQTLDTGSF